MRLLAAMLFIALPASGTQADALGRLFFTPEQRAQLEYRHAHHTADGSDIPSVLTVNGIVQQHGGTRTVWINGSATDSAHKEEPAAETLAVPGKTSPVQIRVGQTLSLPGSTK